MPLLEATAVIKAKDETAAAFMSVERRIAELQRSIGAVQKAVGPTGAAIGNTEAMVREISLATRETDALAAAMGRVGASVGKVEREIGGMTRAMSRAQAAVGSTGGTRPRGGAGEREGAGRFGRLGEVGGLIAPTLGMGALFAGYEGGRELIKDNFARGHERVRMLTSGMSAAEVQTAEMSAAELSLKYSPIGQTEIMHMLRNTRSVVGGTSEAAAIMDPLLALRTVATAAHPDQNMEEDFDKLVKGMEIKGVTQDLPKFRAYMNAMGKDVLAFGDTLRPTDFYEAFKYGRQATQTLSLDYMTMAAPKILQEMGGSSAGTAQAAFYRAIVGGHMEKTALKALGDLGLVEGSYSPKGGHLASAKIRDRDLAATNPYEWVNKILLPAMAKKGIVDPLKIQEVINTLFSKGTAAQLVGLLATQQSSFEKDRRIIAGTESLDAASARFMRDDPTIAAKGLGEALKNLATDIAGGDVAIAHGLNNLANAANSAAVFFSRIHGSDADWKTYSDGVAKEYAPYQHKLNGIINALDPIGAGGQQSVFDPARMAGHQAMVDHDAIVLARQRLQSQIGNYDPLSAVGEVTGLNQELARIRSRQTPGTWGSAHERMADAKRADEISDRLASLRESARAGSQLAALDAFEDAQRATMDKLDSGRRQATMLRGFAFAQPLPSAAADGGRISDKHIGFDYFNSPFSEGAHGFRSGAIDPRDPVEKMKAFQADMRAAAPTNVSVSGSAELLAKIEVTSSSALLSIVSKIENLVKSIPLSGGLLGETTAGRSGVGGIGHR